MILFLVFLFGAAIGSFLNVVICRLYKKESPAHGRSHCMHCKKTLRWYDLIPVLSFIFLRARCRDCKTKISYWYPIVELATGFVFTSIFLQYYDQVSLLYIVYLWYICATLVVIFVYDLKYFLVADAVVYPAIIIAFISQIYFSNGNLSLILSTFLAAVFGGAFFYLQYILTSGKGVGGGDIRLGVLMGAVLGWPYILFALGVAYITGAIISLIALGFFKATMKTKIPFGPFLMLATFLFLLYYKESMGWLFKFLYIGI